jgi:cytochrome c oxidase subunit II
MRPRARAYPMRILVALLISLVVVSHVYAAEDEGASALFQQKCAVCHTIGGGKRVGPDLRGVTDRRQTDWLVRWITGPDQMLADKDPIAVGLLAESGQIPMPNLAITEPQARALIDYFRRESATPAGPAPATAAPVAYPPPSLGPIQRFSLVLFLALTAAITLVFTWVALSTRNPQSLDTHKAYALRRVFLFVTAGALLVALVATLSRTPYAAARTHSDRIVYVAARQFDFVFSLEPIVSAGDLANVPVVNRLELPTGATVEFRVTSLDVNHNFALYGPQRRLLAQTQAMPGYVNRLRVRLTTPGRYEVLCLEYCGAGHHLMRTELTVK